MAHGCSDKRGKLLLASREGSCDEAAAEVNCHRTEVYRCLLICNPFLLLGPLLHGGAVLSLGKAVDAVVLDDVNHVQVPPDGMYELTDSNARRVAVAGDC